MKKRNDEISRLGKIMLFFKNMWSRLKGLKLFSKIKQREKALANYAGNDSPQEAKLSYTFGMIRIVLAALLCLLLCLTLIFGSGIISYENVYYMFKDIQFINSYGESRADQLNYSRPMARRDVAEFKNGLAVASDSEIKLFTSTGRVTMTRGSEYSNPKLEASASSLLVYDQGNRDFAIYNSFTELYREKLDYPISSADMSSSGAYAVVTSSQKHTSLIRIYTNKNKLDMEYSKNDYVIDAAISDDARSLAVLSMSVSGGESLVVITVVDVKKGDVRAELTLRDVMPYSCDFLSDGRIVVMCQDHSAVYDLDLSMKGNYDYPASPIKAVADGELAIMAFRSEGIASNNMIAVMDKNGVVTYTANVTGDVYDIRVKNSYLYVLTGDVVYRLDMRFGTRSKADFPSEDACLAVFDGGEVAVCTDAAAYYITFD